MANDSRLKLLSAQVDVACSFACGPMAGPVIGEAECQREDGSVIYLSLAEVEGEPYFYKTEESTFDRQMDLDPDDEDFTNLMERSALDLGSYEDILERLDDPMLPVYKFLIYLVRCPWDDVEPFIEQNTGKYFDDMDISINLDDDDEYDDEEDDEEYGEEEDDDSEE